MTSSKGFDAANASEAVYNEEMAKEEKAQHEMVRKVHLAHKNRIQMLRRLMIWMAVLGVIFSILFFVAIRNPQLFVLEDETASIVNEAFNSIVLLTIPFLLGGIGAIARLLLSGIRVVDELTLIGGSALMACFSWIGIKSGVLISVIAPHLSNHQVPSEQILNAPNSYYTMALVAIVVGMFSTNLYLFISQRVDQLSKERKGGHPG